MSSGEGRDHLATAGAAAGDPALPDDKIIGGLIGEEAAMPRFSANLGFLFPDIPFLDGRRAARAGFTAVDLPRPMNTRRPNCGRG